MSISRPYRPDGINPLWGKFQAPPPADWKIQRVGKLGTSLKGKLPRDLQDTPFEGSKPYLLIEGLLTGEPQGYTADNTAPVCSETDTVVVADGSRSGLAIRGRVGVLGSTLLAYTASGDTDSTFLFYLVESLYEFLNKAPTGGAIPHLDQDLLAHLKLGVPTDPAEQNRIAETLKAADDHIRAIEDQIRKAERVKKGLVEQGTTIGLRSCTETKTTKRYGYNFTVNNHWDQVELKSLKPEIDYGTNQSSNDYRSGVPVIAIPQVLSSRFVLGELPYAEVSEQETRALALRPHDVLAVRTNGNPSYIGRSTVIPEGVLTGTTIFASYLIRIRVDEQRLRGAYLNYVFLSQTGRIQSNCLANTSAGNFNLGARSLSKFLIPLPSPEEQDEIIQAINAADDLVIELQKQLTAARRVKQSLLQNLLTGKIRLKA